ncbi:MAG: peptidase U32 family protein [Desulfotignum sp.]|nr:peptidase U32 family protein [Desulfotignum sp.]
MPSHTPKILAPAGDKTTFLAAVAAGADAIYCGLKMFSARMEAANFSIEELSRLSRLARSRQIQVHIAFNTLIKESETDKALRLLSKLNQYVVFDALIVQDPAVISLARQAGITQALHLSTLGNLSFAAGLETARIAGFSQVVLPREFSLDDIRAMADQIPESISLEVFIHGALCYGVSGRCYWSSWFGGKSALRGRCVQPCRRMYQMKGERHRYFSCMDFSADVLAKVLKEIPQVATWKIEGRKKSPHYVFYTVKAFQLLRDHPSRKKEALIYLDYALGRPFSHYNLLSHRTQNPLDHQDSTESGLFMGRIQNPAAPFFITRDALFTGDLLRIGNEEEAFHTIQKVTRSVPKKGKFFLPGHLRQKTKKGTPVHLIDRRTDELTLQLGGLDAELTGMERTPVRPVPGSNFSDNTQPHPQRSSRVHERITDIRVSRKLQGLPQKSGASGIWISGGRYSTRPDKNTWLWLDSSIFPQEEPMCRQYITTALKKGARHFVLNAVWQISLFDHPDRLNLWAGPFCNITNTPAIQELKKMGFSGVIVSPELDKKNILSLPQSSRLPLGIVIQGNWPLAVSRTLSPGLSPGDFFLSPKKEGAWVTRSNDVYYIFPNWPLDLTVHRKTLAQAGYTCFVTLEEPVPKSAFLKNRPGLWNWDLTLL